MSLSWRNIRSVPVKKAVKKNDNPIQAAKRKEKQIARLKASEQKLKDKRSAQFAENLEKRTRAKDADANELFDQTSSIPVPPEWRVPEWPYPKDQGNNVDLDLMIHDIDFYDEDIKRCPSEMVHAPLNEETLKQLEIEEAMEKEKQLRKEDERAQKIADMARHGRETHMYENENGNENDDDENERGKKKFKKPFKKKKPPSKVPVVRFYCNTENGCSTCVRVHGLRPVIYVKVPEFIAKNVMKDVFQLDGISVRLALPEDFVNQYPYGHKDYNDAKETLRKTRNQKLAENGGAQKACNSFKDAMERQIKDSFPNYKWATEEFKYNTVIHVRMCVAQSTCGFDFNESLLFFEVKLAFPRMVRSCNAILQEHGLFYENRRLRFSDFDLFNFDLDFDMFSMIESDVSGMTWITLPKKSYLIEHGSIPAEVRDKQEEYERLKNEHEQKQSANEDEKSENENENENEKENEKEKQNQKEKESDEEKREEHLKTKKKELDALMAKEKNRRTFYRCEIDVHWKMIKSHYAEKDSKEAAKWQHIAKMRILSSDIECATKKGHFPIPQENEILTISYVLDAGEGDPKKFKSVVMMWKIPTTEAHKKAGCKDPNKFTFNDDEHLEIWMYDNEEDMLMGSNEFERNVQSPFQLGHNYLAFDMQYKLERAYHLGLVNYAFLIPLKELCRTEKSIFVSKAAGQQTRTDVISPGVTIYDLLRWAKGEKKFPSNTLNYITKKLLDLTKIEVHHSQITDLFWGTAAKRKLLALYNEKDSVLPLKVVWHPKEQILFRSTEIARVNGVCIRNLLQDGQGCKTQSLHHRALKKAWFLAPRLRKPGQSKFQKEIKHGDNSDDDDSDGEEEDVNQYDYLAELSPQFTGATVVKPQCGYYEKPVVVLDFASLYPSIIISANVDYSTILLTEEDRLRFERLFPGQYTMHICQRMDSETGELKEEVKLYFVNKNVRIGFFVAMQETLISTRNRVKEELEQVEAVDAHCVRAALLKVRSDALKLSANSAYGYFSAFKMHMSQLSEVVCAIGRKCLMKTIETIHAEFCKPNGYDHDAKVIYGDSVTGDTPILIKLKNGHITFKNIEELASFKKEEKEEKAEKEQESKWEGHHATKERIEFDEEEKEDICCWTEQGWTRIRALIRHKTDKPIVRVVTHTGCVDVTPDHSLLTPQGAKIEANSLKTGTHLLHVPLPTKDTFPSFHENANENLHVATAFALGLFFAKGRIDEQKEAHEWSIDCEGVYEREWSVAQTIRGLQQIFPCQQIGVVHSTIVGLSQLNKEMVSFFKREFYDSKGQKRVPDGVLNGSIDTKSKFFDGFLTARKHKLTCQGKIATAGLYLIMECLGFSTSIYSDRQEYELQIGDEEKNSSLTFESENENENENENGIANSIQYDNRKSAVTRLIDLGATIQYVYDLETENHHFGAGIGRMIVHNTDSVMILFGVDSVKMASDMGAKARDLANANFIKPMKLTLEKIYDPFLLLAKKNYGALMYAPGNEQSEYVYSAKKGKYVAVIEGNYTPTLDTKGIETKRRDKILLVRSSLEQILNIILWERDVKKAIEYAREMVTKVLKGEVDIADIIKSGSVKEHYATPTRASAVALKKGQRDPNNPPRSGDRVSFLPIKGVKNAKAWECSEDPLYAIEHNLPIDWVQIVKGEMENAYRRILGICAPDLVDSVFEPLKDKYYNPDQPKGGAIVQFAAALPTCKKCKIVLKKRKFDLTEKEKEKEKEKRDQEEPSCKKIKLNEHKKEKEKEKEKEPVAQNESSLKRKLDQLNEKQKSDQHESVCKKIKLDECNSEKKKEGEPMSVQQGESSLKRKGEQKEDDGCCKKRQKTNGDQIECCKLKEKENQKEKEKEKEVLVVQRRKGARVLCDGCQDHYPTLKSEYERKVETAQEAHDNIWQACRVCVGKDGDPLLCKNEDCKLFFTRKKLTKNLHEVQLTLKQITDW